MFGTDKEINKWFIVLAGWYVTTSRILEKTPSTFEQRADRMEYRHHTKAQWFDAR